MLYTLYIADSGQIISVHNGLFDDMCIIDTQLLVDADDDDNYSWMPYQIARAEYIPFQQKLAMEDDMYFVPSIVESEKYFTLLCCMLSDLVKSFDSFSNIRYVSCTLCT